ncbi:hypothetical protein [Phyllobacterium bourgognense]|jgi:hypothetical protein|uniref:Lipoprotein n=1 Tax=Phyllobacterium bourgognense TaxID=314236 RepID=A0A368YYU2_9HYPH|nr:hypothetical protein [Phyllobacterium bourgognense]RCW85363.1 hypothetical protein C7476_103205 [Phyllobacterium bourgognense]
MSIKSVVIIAVIGLSGLPLSACMYTDRGRYYYQYDQPGGIPFWDDGNFDSAIGDHRSLHDNGGYGHHEFGGSGGSGGHGGHGGAGRR